MKKLFISMLAGLGAGLMLSACSTAEGAKEDATQVVNKAGHVAGHAAAKTGHALSHGGEELQEHTDR